ncbi:MAG TPA: hypothetical protein PKN04_14865, partial [bacterium]|nr:hypothetical protein [bacterium]
LRGYSLPDKTQHLEKIRFYTPSGPGNPIKVQYRNNSGLCNEFCEYLFTSLRPEMHRCSSAATCRQLQQTV